MAYSGKQLVDDGLVWRRRTGDLGRSIWLVRQDRQVIVLGLPYPMWVGRQRDGRSTAVICGNGSLNGKSETLSYLSPSTLRRR